MPFDTFQCLDAFEKLTGFITPRLTAVTPLLHRGRKHTVFNGVGNGDLKNFVICRNSLHRGSLHPGLAVCQTVCAILRCTVVHEIHALLLPPHHDACASPRVPPRTLGSPIHCQSVFSNHRRNRAARGCSRTKAANNGRAVLMKAPYCIEFHTSVYQKETCCYCLCEPCFIMY